MLVAVRQSWALLLGVALLMLGNGLMLTLLGVRASLEAFSPTVTGVIQSGYFAGLFAGSLITPRLVGRVGHIRTFAALASVASAAALLHATFVDPVTWTVMRFAGGLCFSGLYVVAESWLNDASSNETRGQVLSIYVIIQSAGFAGGQFMLNLADPTGANLFILTSVLVSLAVVPMLLSAAPAPVFASYERLNPAQLYRISPLGVVTIVGSGLSIGAYYSLAAVYGDQVGLSVADISILMAAFTLGGAILQYPVGRLSDRFDRRTIIILVNLLGAVVALAVTILAPKGWALFAMVFVLGGLAVPTYGLGISHANDFVSQDRMVSASAGLVMVYGASAAVGPLISATLMTWQGAYGLFLWVAVILLSVGVFGFYRVFRRAAKPNAEQGTYVAHSTAAAQATVALYTDYGEDDDEVQRIAGGPLFAASEEDELSEDDDAWPPEDWSGGTAPR